MALPVTITGISTAVGCVGPFQSSGGNYYFFGLDSTNANTVQAFKATDPTSSFSSIASDSSIHLIVCSETITTAVEYTYLTFNMVTDAFVLDETIISGLTIIGQLASPPYGGSIVVRSTGEAVVFFNGAQTKTGGTQQARVYYSRRTGVNTWSAATEVDASGAEDVSAPEAVLGASDRVHFFYTSTVPTNGRERSLSSANALDTELSVSNNPAIQGLSFVSGAATKIVAISGGNATSWFSYFFDSGATPTISTSATTSGTLNPSPNRPFNDGTTVYAVYGKSADGDLYVKSSTDNGATWGTETDIFAATVAAGTQNLSIDGDIYTRDSSVVIPYVVNDNGTLKYNEYIVRTITPPPPTAPSLDCVTLMGIS